MRTTAVLVMAATVLTACGSDSTAPSVATVIITAPKQTIAVGEPVQLSATAQDANGGTIGSAKFTYATAPGGIVSVSATGRVIGVAQGSATITATSGGKTSQPLTIQVVPGNVAAVVTMQANTFTPTQVTIRVNQAVLFDFPADPHNVIFAQRNGKPADIPVPATLPTTVTRAFTTAGTFPYDCMLHPGMSGSVIVNP